MTTVHLPVVKNHISFSEVSTWMECSYRHKLKYLDKIYLDGPNEHTEFGQVMHDALEEFLKTRQAPSTTQTRQLLTEKFGALPGAPALPEKDWHDKIGPILDEAPGFMDETFPGWEFVAAEMELMEEIDGHADKRFKGYIDGVIKVPTKKGTPLYWIIDWKLTSWGWKMEKKTDPTKTLQLVLYKWFLSKKLNLDLKDIRCGFVIVKRTPNKNRYELVPVSVGPVTLQRGLETIDRMLGQQKKGWFFKNRDSCRYCVYANTEHCTW